MNPFWGLCAQSLESMNYEEIVGTINWYFLLQRRVVLDVERDCINGHCLCCTVIHCLADCSTFWRSTTTKRILVRRRDLLLRREVSISGCFCDKEFLLGCVIFFYQVQSQGVGFLICFYILLTYFYRHTIYRSSEDQI